MSSRKKFTESSGNVFEDIGFEKAEARALLLRSQLMVQLEKRLRGDKHRTQQQLADALGIGQSRVSDLLKGKAELFSLDMLVTLATRAGMRVTLGTPATTPVPSRVVELHPAPAAFQQASTQELSIWTASETSTAIVVRETVEASTGRGQRVGDVHGQSNATNNLAPRLQIAA